MGSRIKIEIRGRRYKIGQLVYACIKYLNLPADATRQMVCDAIRQAKPEFTGTPSEVIVQYATILASQGFRIGRKARLTRQNSPARQEKQSDKAAEDFYSSMLWRQVRYMALRAHGARCQCCGASPVDGKRIHVDHIKPRSRFPELALSIDNLQVLCEDCNKGKGCWDQSDWRR